MFAAYGGNTERSIAFRAAVKRRQEAEARRKEEERRRLEYVNRRRHEAALAFEESREIYREITRAHLSGKPSVKQIIAQVAAEHDLSYGDLVSDDRRRPVVAARDEAIARVKATFPKLSLPQIGRHFGDRDHTTILYSLRKKGLCGGIEAIERKRAKAAGQRA